MNSLSYKGYVARVEFDGEDEIFVGHIAGVADVVGFHEIGRASGRERV